MENENKKKENAEQKQTNVPNTGEQPQRKGWMDLL